MDHALFVAFFAVALPAAAQGTLNAFKSWVVGCDNGLRCEAQGYHEGDEAPPAALRVLRDIGPGAPVRLVFAFGDNSSDGSAPMPRPGARIALAAGTLRLSLPPVDNDFVTEVPAAQVPQVLPWLLKADALQLATGGRTWKVSLAGATAALLKMDDLQGRVGTPGALVRKGTQAEPAPAAALPVVAAARVPPPRPADAALAAQIRPAVKVDADTCPLMHDGSAQAQVLRVAAGRVMVVWDCWMAAYQGGSAAWVANDRPPYAPEPVHFESPGAEGNDLPTMLDVTRDDAGRLLAHSAAKGRGIGDCWATRSWAWDGRRFALTEATESPCMAFSAGGLAVTLWRAVLR